MNGKTRCDQNRQIADSLKDAADMILRGAKVLNVYSGEILNMNVVIRGERIWYVGPLSPISEENTRILHLDDKLLVPGYIEPHCHPWNIYNPITFGEDGCRLGTTSLFCDNLVFYILMGINIFEAFMNELSVMPIKYFWSCRTAPQTPMEKENEVYSPNKLERLIGNPAVQSIGEITRWPELLKGNPKIRGLIRQAKSIKKRIDGHTAGAKYEKLNIIARAGVESCHESISGEEVLERLRLGLYVMLRESSLRPDLRNLLKALREKDLFMDRMMLTTDGVSPQFYNQFGGTDNLIRIALEEGVDPASAYRMSTINPAVYFGLDHEIGGIAPGRYADILVLKDLYHPTPEMVISKGRVVAEGKSLIEPFPTLDWERFLPVSSFSKATWLANSDLFNIPCHGNHIGFPTIKLINSVITRKEMVEFEVEDGFLSLDMRDGFSLLALISREGRWVTNGVLQGFGGAVDGLASSYNTAVQILVVGREPEAMSRAVNRVIELKGGIVAIQNGKIAYELPLPLGGMMSDEPIRKLAEKERELKEFLSVAGYPYHDPLYTLTFLPNDFLPEVRINYSGVVDIIRGEILWPRRDLV
ncbi:MAG: adenine deaminase C-terminal domain-containing protein [Pseudomonadota bacterium]